MKYTIHSTKKDYEVLYEKLEKLSIELDIKLNWKKIKRASYDSLASLPDIMRRTYENRKK